MTSMECLTCGEQLEHVPRRIIGCGCDPDAPTWCYIDVDGKPRGLSSARWIETTP